MKTVEEIKSYLKANKITYQQLSDKCGLPVGSLRNLFSGRVPNPRIDTMNAILTALDLNDESETKTPNTRSIEYLMSDIRNLPPDKQETLKPVLESLLKALKGEKEKPGN